MLSELDVNSALQSLYRARMENVSDVSALLVASIISVGVE
jgi:hypothetical protein